MRTTITRKTYNITTQRGPYHQYHRFAILTTANCNKNEIPTKLHVNPAKFTFCSWFVWYMHNNQQKKTCQSVGRTTMQIKGWLRAGLVFYLAAMRERERERRRTTLFHSTCLQNAQIDLK